jgi:hypothetical protein
VKTGRTFPISHKETANKWDCEKSFKPLYKLLPGRRWQTSARNRIYKSLFTDSSGSSLVKNGKRNRGYKVSIEVIKYSVIAGAIILGFILLIIGLKRRWFSSFRAGKDGISFEANQKQLQSENLNKTLDDAISECDHDLLDTATSLADNLRRALSRYLDSFIQYPSGKRTISGAIRFPLYNAIRRNKFKIVLRPESVEAYLDKLMEDIAQEYDEVDAEQEKFICPIHGSGCIEYPEWTVIKEPLRKQIMKGWIIPLKQAVIETSNKKIALYEKYILIFQDIGDEKRIARSKQCIEKNKTYIQELTKKIIPSETV